MFDRQNPRPDIAEGPIGTRPGEGTGQPPGWGSRRRFRDCTYLSMFNSNKLKGEATGRDATPGGPDVRGPTLVGAVVASGRSIEPVSGGVSPRPETAGPTQRSGRPPDQAKRRFDGSALFVVGSPVPCGRRARRAVTAGDLWSPIHPQPHGPERTRLADATKTPGKHVTRRIVAESKPAVKSQFTPHKTTVA